MSMRRDFGKEGSIKDIFALNHAHPFVVQNRYQGFLGGCRCQTFSEELLYHQH